MLGAVFALSSVLIPFFLGAALGGDRLRPRAGGQRGGRPVTSWLNPTSVADRRASPSARAPTSRRSTWPGTRKRAGLPDLVEAFRTRALGAGVVTGLAALGGLLVRPRRTPARCSTA